MVLGSIPAHSGIHFTAGQIGLCDFADPGSISFSNRIIACSQLNLIKMIARKVFH